MNDRPTSGMWFEEFSEGMKIDHVVTRTVTEGDNTFFSTLTMNPQPLHLDADFSSKTEFGQRVVNSLFTLGLVIGMTVYETTLGTTVANLGLDKVSFPAPVFHGDTIRAQTTVLEARGSSSRPESGIVRLEHRGYKQDDAVVVSCERVAMMHRRPAGKIASAKI